MNYALREALRLVVEEGLEARFARHRAPRRYGRARAARLPRRGAGGPPAPDAERVNVPDGVDEATVAGGS